MEELSMLDMNSLNAIAGLLRHEGFHQEAACLLGIQAKATRMLDERATVDDSFIFSKTVNVTNLKNVLCQVPRAVVTDWSLKEGDTLELTYENKTVVIRPNIQRRGSAAEES